MKNGTPGVDETAQNEVSDDASDAEIAWFNLIDLIDPFFGNEDQLKNLLAIAPNPALHEWLSKQIENNNIYKTRLFGIHE